MENREKSYAFLFIVKSYHFIRDIYVSKIFFHPQFHSFRSEGLSKITTITFCELSRKLSIFDTIHFDKNK